MDYKQKYVRMGRICLLVFLILSFLPPLILWIVYDTIPPVNAIMTGWSGVATIYFAFYFVEPISYYPMLGLPGTYMGFMAGGIPNIRIPAMVAAQKVLKLEQGTPKGDIVATISIAASAIVNIGFLIIAAIMGQLILDVLPVFIVSSFDFALPAIVGAVLAVFLLQNPSLLIFCMVSGYVVTMLTIPNAVKTPACVIFGIAYAVIQYRMKRKKAQAEHS